jgi:hypothetical protein
MVLLVTYLMSHLMLNNNSNYMIQYTYSDSFHNSYNHVRYINNSTNQT